MKHFLAAALLFCLPLNALAQIHDRPFFVTGVDDVVALNMPRAVFSVAVPESYGGPVCFRVFDADLSGAHDHWRPGAAVTYAVFGSGCDAEKIGGEPGSIDCGDPLAEVRIQDEPEYDNRWRTLAVLDAARGTLEDGRRTFRFLVDGTLSSSNKYQIFISSDEKGNTQIPGARIQTPFANLAIPAGRSRMTQVRFDIPENAERIRITSFDADTVTYGTRLYFETPYRSRVPIAGSSDEGDRAIEISLLPEEPGGPGAVVMTSEQANYVRIKVSGPEGGSIPLLLPALSAPVNRLPEVRFAWTPLAECTSLVLDGAASTDPDGDELSFVWRFADGTTLTGRRVVHDFKTSGPHEVVLAVTDDSGFVADTARKTETVVINAPPTAMIVAPDRGIPGETIRFDASGSADTDGRITDYQWVFGDGGRGTGAKAGHVYRQPGRYAVSLTVEDDGEGFCRTDRARHEVWINAPPVAHIRAAEKVAANEPLTLDGTASFDSDGAVSGFDWDLGDGTISTGETITHRWQAPGTYEVRLRVTDDSETGNGTAVASATVRVNAPPVPRAAVKAVAAAGEEIRLDAAESSDPDGRITAFAWETGDGRTLTGQSATVIYSAPGIYEGSLTVTDDSGTQSARASVPFRIRINTPPVAVAGEDRVVNASAVRFDGTGSRDADDEIVRYAWDFGDGNKADGAVVTHVYRIPGTYTAVLTVTDGSETASNRASDTVSITVNTPPVADAGADRVAAPGETVPFDGGMSHDPDGHVAFYTWLLDDELIEGESFPHVFDRPGIHQVRLTVSDDHGASDTDYVRITVNAPPRATMAPIGRVAPGDAVTFDAGPSVDPDGEITAYTWQFGDGSPPVSRSKTTHAFKAPGRYPVTLTVKDDSPAANGETTLARIVAVNYPPVADAGPDLNTCGQTILFDGGGSGDPDGDPLAWEWRFGDGEVGFGRRISHTYKTPGRYPVTLTVNDGTGLANAADTDTLTATINASPVAVIKTPRETLCAGDPLLLDGADSIDPDGGALRFVWDLGDGSEETGAHPVRVFDAGGDYTVRLTVFDDSGLPCGTDSAEMLIHVIDAPVARAGDDRTVCPGEPVAFDASRSTYGGRPLQRVEWDFGDGNKGAGVDPVHIYHEPGEYTAHLKVTVLGEGACDNVSEDSVAVRVLAGPIAEIRSPDSGCMGETVSFDAAGQDGEEDAVYSWAFEDGGATEGRRVDHRFETPGDHVVRLTVTTDRESRCAARTAVKTVRINLPPEASIRSESPASPIRPHTILRFSGADSADPDGRIRTYEWDFGDGTTATGLTAAHAYASPGDYSLSLTVADTTDTMCNRTTAVRTVHVAPEPELRITGPGQGCVNEPILFSLEGFDGPTESVEWYFGDGTTASGRTVETVFSGPGRYAVQANAGTDAAPAHMFRAAALPDIFLPPNIEALAGDRVEIRAMSETPVDSLTLTWDAGDGNIVTGDTFSRVWKTPGDAVVTLTVNGPESLPCLVKRYDIPVTIHPPPQVDIETEPTDLFAGGARDEAVFKAAVRESALPWLYRWRFGDGASAEGPVAVHAFDKGGKYAVSLTLRDALGISDQSFRFEKRIEVKKR